MLPHCVTPSCAVPAAPMVAAPCGHAKPKKAGSEQDISSSKEMLSPFGSLRIAYISPASLPVVPWDWIDVVYDHVNAIVNVDGKFINVPVKEVRLARNYTANRLRLVHRHHRTYSKLVPLHRKSRVALH